MIIILKKGFDPAPLLTFLAREGVSYTLRQDCVLPDSPLGFDPAVLKRFPAVGRIVGGGESFRLSERSEKGKTRQVRTGDFAVGDGLFALCAGPCAVESEEQALHIACCVKAAGATLFRGGAFKPRTSPYAFGGLREEGLRLLSLVKKETGLPLCSEVMGVTELPLFEDIDVLQIGARNMQNYDLLREVGTLGKPVLLKRGMSATVTELLLSAEYILSGGAPVILCERGIRSFDERVRNTLDLSAVPLLHELCDLPVLVDPSHATGKASLVPSMALAAAAAGADGLMIEVHHDPLHARSDGAQALSCEDFAALTPKVLAVRKAVEL